MKRKLFSLMVAACVALFSFSGLTGCSGGGEDAKGVEKPGYLTYNGFTKKMHGIRLEAAAAWLTIQPYAPDDAVYGNSSTSVSMVVGMSNDDGMQLNGAIANYSIKSYSYADANGNVMMDVTESQLNRMGLSVDDENVVPYRAVMTVTLGSAADTSSQALLAALGLNMADTDVSVLAGKIELNLLFDGNGGTLTTSVVGAAGEDFWYSSITGTIVQNRFDVWGRFSVIK